MDSSSTSEAGPSQSSTSFERWRSAFAAIAGPSSTPESEEDRMRLQDEKDYNKCEKWKMDLMRKSPMITFMLKQLDLAGCSFSPSNIQCYACPPTTSGGFSSELGILLCQNQLFGKKHLEDTLAHEMIHAFDHCRFKMDPENLRHHACTEIRAASLSGECNWAREFFYRGHYWNRATVGKHHQECVKRRAATSVSSNPACPSRAEADKAVNEVFESCFKDTRPFDEIY
ncbi:metalloprotease ATP23 [Kockovaella imperatae]|uniref:Mitochondrial inner membrane protease ATP23 n=1 Tax=Kockovaella imperatae TaxID=4999 RepID=A0A1Y1UM12_9TREE|nr:metalloprotease ATP23 [Kockovaella imperatae]ORX38526.1 metalloprotease ATP23 [Kockovaella imperatae]